ncbi:hypothetical protein D3C80_710240 [compost metagenome]
MDKYFALSNGLKLQLEEGLPVADYLKQMNDLERMYKQDAESAEKRTTSLRTP